MKEKSELIKTVDIQPIIRKATETNKWDFSSECTKLYRRAEVIMARFYGLLTPEFPNGLPAPLIAVDLMNIRTLAAYHIVPDEYGLPYKLMFNERHFEDQDGHQVWRYGEWSQMETLVHELGHHWQEIQGRESYKKTKISHGKEFTAKMASLGIYSRLGHGSHYAVADAEGPFGLLMKEWGIARPKDVPREEGKKNWWVIGGESIRGQSSLIKWHCAICSFAIRVGVKADIDITHNPDGGKFIRG